MDNGGEVLRRTTRFKTAGGGLIQYGFSKLLTKLHKLRYWDTVQVLSSE